MESSMQATASGEDPARASYRFLIVDDNADALFFAERTLKRVFAGCEVLRAHSASAALDILKHAGSPHAIVTDNDLGGTSGRDLVCELRRRGFTCPIVMLTCSGNPKVCADAYKAGATKVFQAGEAADATFAFSLKEQLSSGSPNPPA
jgi:DNA-binding NtrC family response regulator